MLKTSLIILAVLAVLLTIAGYLIATHVLPYTILQPGRRTSGATPADHGLAFEHFQFHVREHPADSTGLNSESKMTDSLVTLDAFYIPSATTPKANLIMLHGVGSCKEVYLGSAAQLTAIGYNILLWDQRAHGKSGGEFLTYGYHEKFDVSLAIDWLEAKNPGVPTGIYGNSMGGAIAIQSMAHNPGLRFGLIESTFTDLPTVANAYGRRMSGLPLPRWLSDYVLRRAGQLAQFDAFAVRPVDAARRVTQPIQHIHGDADANINISHAHALFEAYASTDKQLHVVKNGDHADLWDKGGDGYREVWFGFLRRMPGNR